MKVLSEPGELLYNASPRKKLRILDLYLKHNGFSYSDDAGIETLSDNFIDNKFNCLTYALVGYVVGRELGWPIHIVCTRNHVFLRWDNGKTRINFDQGKFTTDELYRAEFQIFPENSIYLKNLTESQVLALIDFQ